MADRPAAKDGGETPATDTPRHRLMIALCEQFGAHHDCCHTNDGRREPDVDWDCCHAWCEGQVDHIADVVLRVVAAREEADDD